MKAGIYKRTDNGKHVYVSKDRHIKAHELADCHPTDPPIKVRTHEKEQYVSWDNTYAARVADVPNGCTDPDQVLTRYVRAQKAILLDAVDTDTEDPYRRSASSVFVGTGKTLTGRFEGRPPALGLGYALVDADLGDLELRQAAAVESLKKFSEATCKAVEALRRPRLTGTVQLSPLGRLGKFSYRCCGKQSARKHRKAGHEVVRVNSNTYGWRKP